jgi:cobyric acid synthase
LRSKIKETKGNIKTTKEVIGSYLHILWKKKAILGTALSQATDWQQTSQSQSIKLSIDQSISQGRADTVYFLHHIVNFKYHLCYQEQWF